MASSLNGWPAIRAALDPRLRKITIPGTTRTIVLRRGVAPVFAAFLSDWHREMPKRLRLEKGPVDGWNFRQANYADGYSNHASGTACDVRYDVLKADGQPHMTDEERKVLKRILKKYVTSDGHQILANGYVWNKCDEMHTELSQAWDTKNGAKRDTTFKDVKDVQKRLGIDSNGVIREP